MSLKEKIAKIPYVSVIKILSNRFGIHKQTNLIFKEVEKLDVDFIFNADDDIFFNKKGWDELYIQSSIKSGYDHLCYFNKNIVKGNFNIKNKKLSIQSYVKPERAFGCFWTFTKDLLKKVGNIDSKSFGFRGQGHIDFTLRCCRLGFNDKNKLYDALDSENYISLYHQNQNNYISTFKNHEPSLFSRTKTEVDRKRKLLADNTRKYIKV